ncbi:platelet glycoprotein V-like [Lineus longissimus]|uniref:platelet glycoprotein V-like n=1 Tax=Lineus longissimus TaxID=88925 RepID=UPI00315CBBF8
MAANHGQAVQFWFILLIILCIIFSINAQNCHKACTCKTDVVLCIGTNVTKINETNLRDIIQWTPATTIQFTIFRANLPTIPNVFTRFTRLQSLGLMSCNITSIVKDAFLSLKSLTKLHISDNPFKNFPADIFKGLVNLEMANFTHNALETLLLNEFSGLVKLKKLFLNQNKISKLDGRSFHSDLKSLETLHINHNSLGSITNDTFSPLQNLQELDIGWQSPLIQIPPGLFTPLKNLKSLFMTDLLNHTGWNTIPNGLLSGLDMLTYLDVRMNNLRSITAADFQPVSKTLISLYLGHNYFPKISKGIFKNLNKLEMLDMYDCGIQEIDNGAFQNLKSLKRLNLESNKLQNLTPEVLKPVKNATISLRHNSFLCDCALLDMFEWIKSENLVFNLTCASPLRLLHKKLYQLKREDLRCIAPILFSGKPQFDTRAEVHMSVALKCRATSYSHFANMSYKVLEGNPVPKEQLIDVEEKKWTETLLGDKTYYTELRINIREIREENSGKITCEAWNKYGNDTGVLKLTVYPQRWAIPLWALIIILILVLLIVGGCIGLLVYHYKYRSVPISTRFQSPARYARQDNMKAKPVSSISSSRTVLRPDRAEPEYQPNSGYGGPDYGYGDDRPDFRYDRGEYNVAYLPEAPSMYVTYV